VKAEVELPDAFLHALERWVTAMSVARPHPVKRVRDEALIGVAEHGALALRALLDANPGVWPEWAHVDAAPRTKAKVIKLEVR